MILRRKLNSDDLILFYLAMKLKNELNNIITEEELVNFLTYFNNKKTLFDFNTNYEYLIEHLLLRKKRLWGTNSKLIVNNNGVSATYSFNTKDIKETEIACLSDTEISEIKDIINLYLNKFDKRKLNLDIVIDDNIKRISDEFSALMCKTIWSNYISLFVSKRKWPIQCQDLNKYLFDMDLAQIIDLPSIKDDLLSFYKEFSKRLGVLMTTNEEIILNNDSNYFLAYSNYLLCINGFDKLLKHTNNKKIKMEIKNKKDGELITGDTINNNITTNNELKMLVKTLNERSELYEKNN